MEDKSTITRFSMPDPAIPVIDVRSPSEFEGGHIPGAINLPLFNNPERADVGTIYKQDSPFKAYIKGLQYVGPKMADFVLQAKNIAIQNKIAVYCWRGGQRSNSMGWLLGNAGFEVTVLPGGYKAYRNHIHDFFTQKINIQIVGGETGSGKTDILKQLANAGDQVIDLEAIAHHRGSSFGALGLPPQPSVEQFENNLHQALRLTDPHKPVWMEDESRSIGRVYIPEPIWKQMLDAPVFRISIPRQVRIERLVKEYGLFTTEELTDAILRIKKRLGDLATREALDALQRNDLNETALIALKYYDKAYNHNHAVKNFRNIHFIASETADPNENATKIRTFVQNLH